MSNISISYAERDYSRLKESAFQAFSKNKLSDSFKFIKAASSIAYHLNFRYSDDEFEKLLKDISYGVVGNVDFKPIRGRIVLYDFWGLDNKGLSQQYINAISNLGTPFLYILMNDNLLRSQHVLKQIKENRNAEILVISSKLSDEEKLRKISNAIKHFKPENAFLHTCPWDVVGVCVFNSISVVNRYLINLTDHAFWLGKNCCDYFIEFRDYGGIISVEQRKIQIDKLLYLPYYPVINDVLFKGFPINTNGKTVLFSGGSVYKIYGENDKYFKILHRILDENQNTLIFFAGGGNLKHFANFINKFNLHKKIFLLGNRGDINEIFRHSDLYISTYPITGGLMCQYAVKNGVLPIGYSSLDIPCNFIESLIDVPDDITLTYTDIEEFHSEINKTIQSKEYRRNKMDRIIGIPTERQFVESFKKIISNNKPSVKIKKPVNFDKERFENIYLTMENDYLHSYFLIKFSHLKLTYFRYRFWDAMFAIFKVMKIKAKKLIS